MPFRLFCFIFFTGRNSGKQVHDPMKHYFYKLLRRYLSLFVLPQNSVVEIDPTSELLVASMPDGKVTFLSTCEAAGSPGEHGYPPEQVVAPEAVSALAPDYIVISGVVHYERDIQTYLARVHGLCNRQTRLIITYYSSLWKPLVSLATLVGWRKRAPETNWLAHEDIGNLLALENYEVVRVEQKILAPVNIPLLSWFLNRMIAPLPFFRAFCLLNIAVARPLFPAAAEEAGAPSVSIVVPARNEAGNIERIVERIPKMGPSDEIIFIEGNSTDNTWQTVQEVQKRYGHERAIVIDQQKGKGKGDAVRLGFSLARNDILMILDADMTVPPEDLPKFYRALSEDKGEFINGSRLVYPMDKEAMRFFNMVANKFFALAFSFVLGQRFKDTLCGTKVLTRENYLKLARNRSYFGEFDPFGDFDLIFGAARMGLKIVELPIGYRERTYGETNISRWKHGVILLAMLLFAAKKIRFL
jgi:hypothetical protein